MEQRAAPLLGRVDGQSEGSRSQEGRKKEKRMKKKKGKREGGKEKRKKQVARGQYVVSDTCCLALHDCELKKGSGPEGDKVL